ncbi:unnamed protein product [Enterobius vermicularis]|uniref:Isovaleryl-CoA dehydrogenase, mitochondrial n=1 Tax=Enterobius vermicularis TaxID=51028 RepID=A0A0N4V1B4_ENTVE|nr:unnamed protein product [Enterobius vermicularis]
MLFQKFWKKLGKLGLLGITVSSEFGGSEMSYLEHVIAMEELSRVSGALGLSYGAHSNLCVNQIALNGSQEQKQKYLPRLISGDHIGALAMSESSAGSDVVSMMLTAKKDGNNFIINGSKFWITNGPDADVTIVYAKTEPTKGKYGITAFLVEKDFPGFSKSPKFDKFGMRGSNTCELIFDNCVVPEENVIGKVNEGVRVLMSGLNYERLVLAGGPLGIMQAACELAFDYANQRKTFGKKIGNYQYSNSSNRFQEKIRIFQLIQAKIADMDTLLTVCRHHVYNTAMAVNRGELTNRHCAAAIYYASKCGVKVCDDALQILGGNGYVNEYPAGRFYRDARLYEIGAGTSEIRQLIIANEINSMEA